MDQEQTDYLKYRGNCYKECEKLVAENPALKMVRGHYDDPIWGPQPHWWCVNEAGEVIDPTKNQFPSKGFAEYIEFDGNVECSQCGRRMKEDEAHFESNYCFCSTPCHMRFVGLGEYIR